MTLEDSKRISQVISSEDSLDSLPPTATNRHIRNLSNSLTNDNLPSNQSAAGVTTSTPVHSIMRTNSKDIGQFDRWCVIQTTMWNLNTL